MLICPAEASEQFLIPGHAYLFKSAEGWRRQQIWSEIVAYRIASLVGLDVPPCFLAVNEHSGQVGALIELKLAAILEPIREVLESDESDVIHWWALDSLESARCGSLNTALQRTAVAFVTRAI